MMTKFISLVAVATVLLPVATVYAQDLAPINPNNLDESGAHVCVSTAQETYSVLESYTAYSVGKTNTWCFAFPPRCTKYYIVSHTAYRTVTKTRSRKRLFCCVGYTPVPLSTYCKPLCPNDCYNSQGHGYCAFPGTCLCNEGYKGASCESGCDEGEWGADCTKSCNCGSFGSCDPTNGNCICHIGMTGPRCDQPCVNSFGMHCVHPCVCENNATCDNINGKCTCKPGFYGAYCHKKCDATSIAEQTCVQECPCQNGGTCSANGTCTCKAGYQGEYCTVECDKYHWGVNCQQNCDCYHGDCHPATGECTCDYGYGGVRCNEQCKPGHYGTLCATKCPCENNGTCYFATNGEVKCNCTQTGFHGITCTVRDCPRDQYLVDKECQDCTCPWTTTESCHPLTASCQCKLGYTGDQCQSKCSMPYWGLNCREICTCAHGDCQYKTGECTSCYAGYNGTNCDQKCPQGTWGIGCANACGCLNNANCHATTGFCNCTSGYKGLLCDQPCAQNEWGKFCASACSCNLETSICSPYTGVCQCKPGYYGDNCQNKCTEWQYGFQCRHECQCDRQGSSSCDHATGECKCAPGYKGVSCSSRCPDTRWGPNCKETCDCRLQGSCDQNNGSCICYAGFHGNKCENICDDGFYGYNCTDICPDCTGGTHCDHVTGQCISDQCPAGMRGNDCKTPCPIGTWGVNCANKCATTCTTNGICSPMTGHCFCFPGYSGTNCEQGCDEWRYGISCSNECQCVQDNTESCTVSRGICKCKPGFQGERCEIKCDVGKWGPGCIYNCSSLCHHRNSVGCDAEKGVPCDCVDGYQPPLCDVESKISITGQQKSVDAAAVSTPIMVVIIIAALVAVGIIALLVVYFRCKIRRLKDQNLSVRYAANGTLPAETIIPNGGLVNPTYAEDNLNNERRYPHLSQRRPLPTPQRPCSGESFDSIEEEKRNSMASQRPESSHYHELDEDRYTTLRSMAGARSSSTDTNFTKNLHVDLDQSKVSDKSLLCSGDTEGSRSPKGSKEGTRNINHGFEDGTNLKQNNINVAAAFRPSFDLDPPNSMATNNRLSSGYEKPLQKVSNYDNATINQGQDGSQSHSSPQQTTADSLQRLSNGGYITPQNAIHETDSGTGDTLPFSAYKEPEVETDTPGLGTSDTPRPESNNMQNWITFDGGRTEQTTSPNAQA